jgi:predicted dehydrogenase
MDRKHRVAIVGGAGTWGRHYLHWFAQRADCDVIALVDTAQARCEHFAQHYHVPRQFASIGELLREDRPDIICCILPVSATYDAVLACAEAGIRVVSCEKPLAAELARGDELVRTCADRGTLLACGTAFWEVPYFLEAAAWVHAGNIGALVSATIPRGLGDEVSGAGCPQLVMLRHFAGADAAWVEGVTIPPEAAAHDEDCGVVGRLGFASGLECEVPHPSFAPGGPYCPVTLEGTQGRVLLTPPPIFVQRTRGQERSVRPKFLENPPAPNMFVPAIDRLVRALETGELLCTARDYLHALEIAAAFKISARSNGSRVPLPLLDRSALVRPIPYRWQGGDIAGWAPGGYSGPPGLLA